MSTERRPYSPSLISGREPLPSFNAWLAANRSRLKPGSVNQILIMHDHGCRYPWGERCTCRSGPEITLAGENPGSN